MQILPVLDLKHGRAVRAIAGRRAEYQPLTGPAGSQPLDVAHDYRDRFGLDALYLADLDAIAGAEPAWSVYASLHAAGFTLWLDAGVRHPEQADALAAVGITRIIAGLETLAGPDALAAMVTILADRLVFSLDLRDGEPIVAASTWQGSTAGSIADEAIALGVRRLLVLDLSRIGRGEGTGTEPLLAAIHQAHPAVELLAGGGVRSRADLERLQQRGVSAVLLGSALQEGSFALSWRETRSGMG